MKKLDKINITTILGLVIILIIGWVSVKYFLKDTFKDIFWTNPCEVKFSEVQFKILILTFNKKCSTERGLADVGDELAYRLETLKVRDTLDIAVCYQSVPIGSNIEVIRKKYGADQIIYGKNDPCGSDSTQICVNFTVDEFLAKSLGYLVKPTQIFNPSGLKDAELQGSIDYHIYLFSGIAALNSKKYERAYTYFTRAIAKNPEDKYGHYYREQCGSFISVFQELGKTLADYNEAIDLNPEEARNYLKRGNLYQVLQKYDQTFADYNKALALDPTFADVYNNRGNLYRTLKKYDEALADYSQALILDPILADAYNNRGLIYQEYFKKYDKALADYNKTLTLDPNKATTYNNRGYIYQTLQKFDEALVDFNRAIDLDSNLAIAYHNRGSVYQTLQKFDEALTDYNQALNLDPNYVTTYNNRGYIYQVLKKYDKALADFNKAIDLNAYDATIYNNRGYIYQVLKKYDKALADFNKAIDLNADDAKTYNNLGYVYQTLQKFDEALANYDKALNLDPDYATSYYNRATLKVKMTKEPSDICKDLRKAAQLGHLEAEQILKEVSLCP